MTTANTTPAAKPAAPPSKPIHERVREAMQQQRDRGPTACWVDPCPCAGSTGLGGRLFCRFHAWITPDRYDEVSAELTRHDWLLHEIAELMRLERTGPSRVWLAQADNYFGQRHPELKPVDAERKHLNFYLWRLREHLAYFVGVRAEVPTPRTPQAALLQRTGSVSDAP